MSRRVLEGPGLARCGVGFPFSARVLRLVRCADELWSGWLEAVDVVSEGAAVREGAAFVYRGSTSLIVLSDRCGGSLPEPALAQAAQVATHDPHFWLRCLRMARREALSRSPGSLDSLRMELRVRPDPRGVRVDIDVEGEVLSEPRVVKTKR